MNSILRKIVWLVMLVPAAYLAIIWKHIPQTVPMHFDLKGNINKYGSKNDLLIMVLCLTLLNAITYLVITNIYKVDPKKYAAQNKERLQRIGFYINAYLAAVWVMLIYVISHSNTSITMKFVFVAMGLFFSLLGSNMYNIKPNYFAGIRLPWTLESDENWRRTHQFAGRLWFFSGLIFAAIALLLNHNVIAYFGGITLAALVIIPIIYSYTLYKNQTKKI